jgi:HEPN domain-containing protein
MTPITREWVEKAESDYRIASREARVRREPSYDGVCFHAQQCAEKYLKARLQEAGVEFPKTHDAEELMNRLLGIEPQIATLRSDLKALAAYAVDFRYPGISADRQLAREALEQCTRVRSFIRATLGLPVPKRPKRAATTPRRRTPRRPGKQRR